VGVAVELVPPEAIGKVPVTSALKETGPKVGAPEALPWSTVVAVPAAVLASAVVELAYGMPYWVKGLDWPVPPAVFGSTPVVSAEVEVAYRAPPDVKELKFVPPFAVDRVPDKVTAPVEAVLGVKPVVPALNDVTPLAPLPTLAQVVPL
jgi:hypothetical protein